MFKIITVKSHSLSNTVLNISIFDDLGNFVSYTYNLLFKYMHNISHKFSQGCMCYCSCKECIYIYKLIYYLVI